MKSLLRNLSFDIEEIEEIYKEIENTPILKIESVINLFKRYGCDKDFIKHILRNRKDIFLMDCGRLEYILDAIIANDDIIEETLLELI